MTVSVLVPSFNHAPFVERTLRSIFAQTYPPEKLIVIDDGSKDESTEIIERVLLDCPFPAEFIRRENRGLSATLNEGFSKTTGDFFAYLGSDDVWLPEFLENRIRHLMKREDAVVAFGNSYLIDENDGVIDNTTDWQLYSEEKVLSNLLRGLPPVTTSVVFRRSSLNGLCWNEKAALEDYELYLRLTAKGAFVFDEKVLAGWRQHSYNTSGDFGKMLNEWLAAQNRAAPALGIDAAELENIQTKLKFICVTNFIRQDRKAEAIKLLRENWRGADSAIDVGKTLMRLLIPGSFYEFYKHRRRRKFTERYGKV